MDNTNLTDEEIVRITREENKEFYTHLVRRYEPKLSRYIKRYIKGEDVVEDVLQSTFIKAYENLQSFDIKRKFNSWIYRIAHNEALNKIKREKRSVSGLDPEVLDIIAKEENGPEFSFEKEEIKNNVRKCLENMDTKYKDVLILYYLENKKYEEISDILRVPSGTVATWISRGKNLLKKECQKLK